MMEHVQNRGGLDVTNSQPREKNMDHIFEQKKLELLSSFKQSEPLGELANVKLNDVISITWQEKSLGNVAVFGRGLVKDLSIDPKASGRNLITMEFIDDWSFVGKKDITLSSVKDIIKITDREKYFARRFPSGKNVEINLNGANEKLSGTVGPFSKEGILRKER